jgi:glutamate-cysteine ligase
MRFGLEAEFALVHQERGFCDFTNLTYAQAQAVVDRLPDLGDPDLTRGDLLVKVTRWYVEGDERFAADGTFLDCVPKGLETRTPICAGIAAAVDQLAEQTAALAAAATVDGYRLASIGRNPWHDYRPDPPYNAWELAMRARHPEYAGAEAYMVGYGPDLNLSHPGWPPDRVLDVARKLTALSPGLVPFSFSSPFAGGEVVALSARTLIRAPRRPSARAFLPAAGPPPAVRARIPAEVGRVEFKAFDALPDPALYPPLLALLAGLALDRTLPDRADRPDPAGHERAARHGLADPDIRATAARALDAADRALAGRVEASLLAPLRDMLDRQRTPAHDLIDAYRDTGQIPLP